MKHADYKQNMLNTLDITVVYQLQKAKNQCNQNMSSEIYSL
jgi:hypothetical protein